MKKVIIDFICLFIPARKWWHSLRKNLLDIQKRKTEFVLDYMNAHPADLKLKELINGKNVAIIGNGPQQIGRNTGQEIDQADIVVRFNQFLLTGYEADYGARTDIWFNGCGGKYNDAYSFDLAKKIKLVVWRDIYLAAKTIKYIVKFLYKCIQSNRVNLVLFPKNILYAIDAELGEGVVPTAGAVFISYLYKYTKPNSVRFYGFSFLDEKDNSNSRHYYRKDEIGGPHNMNLETKMLRKICGI